MFNSIRKVLIPLSCLVAIVACSDKPAQPSPEQKAFMDAVAPYCGPIVDPQSNDQACNVILLYDDGPIVLVSGFDHDGFVPMVSIRGTRNILNVGHNHLTAMEFDLTHVRLVGPKDSDYLAANELYMNAKPD